MAAKEESPANFLDIRQDNSIQRRNSTDLSDDQVLALEAVSLSFATISVFAAFVAFYWFVRMRRSFRQDLIMLLIQSDMMKAFWLMLSPIIYFISGPDGPINTNNAYCQISGFFLTAAIEASDIAVLMIAIHSALYILRSQRAGGETGLHPYRWYAYAIWFVVPLVMAALIPLTGARFEDNGPFCYLPVQDAWYRVYLSWVPRYIIFGIIFLVYTFLYVYIAWRFRRLRLDQRRASYQSSSVPKGNGRRRHAISRALPPTPPLASYGLLDSSSSQAPEDGQRSRQQSVASDVSTLKSGDNISAPLSPQRSTSRYEGVSVSWDWIEGAYNGGTDTIQQQDEMSSTPLSPTAGSMYMETALFPTPPPAAHQAFRSSQVGTPQSHVPSPLQHTPTRNFRRRALIPDGTVVDPQPTILGVLDRGPVPASLDASNDSSPSLLLPLSGTEDTLHRSRDKMNRQLRLLFVYPAIYILAWIAPFVSHIYTYENTNSLGMPQPYGLFIASISSLCIGAAVDCGFYSAWEKPWRHSKVGFWQGLAMRLKLAGHRPQAGGRSRDEERREATAAIDRRNVEQAEREAAAASMQMGGTIRKPRHWWDLETDKEQHSAGNGSII